MRKIVLNKAVVGRIHDAVDKLFDRVKARFLEKPPVDKRIVIGYWPRQTIPGLYQAASHEEGVRPDQDVLAGLVRVAEGFIEAQREATKAHTVKAVQSFLNEAARKGVKANVETVLGGQLYEVFGKAHDGLKRILATEATNARNVGALDGIVRVNASQGIEDPVVYFVVVRDDDLCEECRRLHLGEDGVTPRVWFLSELKHGYHTKADDVPSVGGEHPHCRCSLVTLMPGYGFDEGGGITFVSLDHDETAAQRKTKKSEFSWAFEALEKSRPEGIEIFNQLRPQYEEWGDQWEPHEEESEEHRKKAAGARVTVNFPRKAVRGLAETGRFLNQYETGTSLGAYSPEGMRPHYEHKVLGIPKDTHYEQRPVYGAVTHHPSHVFIGGAPSYGDAFAVLKPHVHDRVSVTPEDSFDVEPSHVMLYRHLPSIHKLRRERGIAPRSHNYIEAQIHGGVSLGQDVEALHMAPDFASPDVYEHEGKDPNSAWEVQKMVEMGRRHRIPVYRHRWVSKNVDERPYAPTGGHVRTEVLYEPPKARTPEQLTLPGLPPAPAPESTRTSPLPPPETAPPSAETRPG